MDPIATRQFQAMWQLKRRLLGHFWKQRGQAYRWSLLISFIFSALLAIAVALGFSFLVYYPSQLTGNQRLSVELLPYIWIAPFLALSVMWMISPLIFVMKNESLSLDISRLTRYPISYRSLHLFHTLLAWLEPWTLFFYPLAVGLFLAGLAWGKLSIALPLLILIALWMAVHTLWNRLFQDLITLLFTSRYLREVLSLLLLLTIILLSFIPALISEQTGLEDLKGLKAPNLEMFLYQWPTWQKVQPLLNGLIVATPTGYFVKALAGLYGNQWQWWWQGCLGLVAWVILAQVLGVALLRRLFSEPPAVSQVKRTELGSNRARHFKLPLSEVLRVLILKDLRTLFRSILGKLSFFLTPLLVVILRVVGLGAAPSTSPEALLLGMISYIFMTSLFLYINFFGPDGHGFKLYLLSATSPRQLLLAKNLALALFASGEFAVVLVLFVVFYQQASLALISFACCSFVTLLAGVLSLGTLLSIRFPAQMDLNQTQYRQSNGTPVLMALQVLMVLSGLAALPLGLAYFQAESLTLLSFCMSVLSLWAWWLILKASATQLQHEQLNILAQLEKD